MPLEVTNYGSRIVPDDMSRQQRKEVDDHVNRNPGSYNPDFFEHASGLVPSKFCDDESCNCNADNAYAYTEDGGQDELDGEGYAREAANHGQGENSWSDDEDPVATVTAQSDADLGRPRRAATEFTNQSLAGKKSTGTNTAFPKSGPGEAAVPWTRGNQPESTHDDDKSKDTAVTGVQRIEGRRSIASNSQ